MKLSDQWLFFPGLGIGYRTHNNNHGWDVDLSAYSYWVQDSGFSIYGKGHYLFFPKGENWYLGAGAGVIGGHFYSEFTLGKEIS